MRMLLLAWLGSLTACEPGQRMPAAGGQLYVNSDPAGAAISCDGRPAAQPAPTTLLNLATGDHLIVARLAGYRESRATINIQPGARASLELQLEPLGGLVLIKSQPAGAEVEINGVHRGQTPLFIPDFPLGQRQIKLSAPDHLPKTLELTLTDRTPQEIAVSLLSDSAQLTFSSQPPGAQVMVNGTIIGKTPCGMSRLAAGKHRVEISLPGHTPYQDELVAQPGEERLLSVNLQPLPGKLSVITTPPQARLYLNNQYKAITPLLTNTLAPGRYLLRAELPGYAVMERTLVLTAGQEAVVEFQMNKNSGTLLISSEPPGVSVYLDGASRGLTKPRGQELISEQLTIDYVPQGSHSFQLTKPGYYDLAGTLELAPNQTLILHKKLMARPVPFIPNVSVRTGIGPEHIFRGIIREKYDGDIKLEIEPGIFKNFKASEILSLEPIASPD